MNTITTARRRGLPETQIVSAAAVVAGLLIFAASLSPTLDLVLTAGTPALVLAVLIGRRVARVLRWRREDRADAVTAAAWRAAHQSVVALAAAGQEVA